jgi:hypothetical protein
MVACLMPFVLTVACGDDDAPATADGGPGNAAPSSVVKGTGTPAAAGDHTTAPVLDAPASKYSVLLDDVGPAFLTDIPGTFVLDAKSYGKTSAFGSPDEGEATLKKWGYLGGYETGLIPEGRDIAILNGAFSVHVEIHLFKTLEGAKASYDYFHKKISGNGKAQAINTSPVGNESAAWKTVLGLIRNSTINQSIHQMVFRRGTMVAIIATTGAEPFMRVESALEFANLIDQKALGQVETVEPTPTSNYTPPAYPPAASRTAAATATAKPR